MSADQKRMSDIKQEDSNVFVFPKKSRYKPDNLAPYIAANLPTEGPLWMKEMRGQALARLKSAGLPTPKLERWKYINLTRALKSMELSFGKAQIEVTGARDCVRDYIDAQDKYKITLSRPAFGSNAYKDMMLADYAQAYSRDGLIVDIAEDKSEDKVLNIVHTGTNNQIDIVNTLFVIRAGASATIIENHTGEAGEAYWKNILSRIIMEQGACLTHIRIQDDSQESVHTQNTEIEIADNAQYKGFTLTSGGALSRHQIHARIQGSHADCTLNGVNMLHSTQSGDTTITIDHLEPDSTSNQFYRTVLNDKARGVFQGKVHVHQKAQRTDGYQLANALMLSDMAEMDTKPELEIYADDVKCSHGATTGQLEDEPLFYMKSRGIPEKQAKKLLMLSFLAEVTDQIEHKETRERIEGEIETWLNDALEKI